MTVQIVLVNGSKRLKQDDLVSIAKAMRVQAAHLAIGWPSNRRPVISTATAKAHLHPNFVPILIVDTPDIANALGYHDVSPLGVPYGRVFVDPVLDNGGTILNGSLSVSAVVSHEVCEWAIDPFCQLWADEGSDGGQVALEVGDPVQGDSYNIVVKNAQGVVTQVAVSNFVFEQWFYRESKEKQFDWMGKVNRPFVMTPGGYLIYRSSEGNISQQFESTRETFARLPLAALAPTKHVHGSRTFRKMGSITNVAI
jgi:hypothetical protein